MKSGKITSTDNGNFGIMAYKIPTNYKGKKITLEGYMKIENVVDGFAGLLLRIDENGVFLRKRQKCKCSILLKKLDV